MTWVAPAVYFFDRIDATDQRRESRRSGRVIAFITSSTTEWFRRPFHAMQPRACATQRRTSSCARSTRATVSMVPVRRVIGRVIERENTRLSTATTARSPAPISSIMGACAKHVFLVTDAGKLEATLRSAFEIARTGRPGPVVVDIPKDVQNADLIFAGRGSLPLPGYRARLRSVDTAMPPCLGSTTSRAASTDLSVLR